MSEQRVIRARSAHLHSSRLGVGVSMSGRVEGFEIFGDRDRKKLREKKNTFFFMVYVFNDSLFSLAVRQREEIKGILLKGRYTILLSILIKSTVLFHIHIAVCLAIQLLLQLKSSNPPITK